MKKEKTRGISSDLMQLGFRLTVVVCLLLLLNSCSKYFYSYDYYSFDDKSKNINKIGEENTYPRSNLLFENKDIQIIAELEERKLPPFVVLAKLKALSDSLQIKSFNILLAVDSLVAPSKSFLNVNSNTVIYFNSFSEVAKQIRYNPDETIYFGFSQAPNKDVLGLNIVLDYQNGNKAFSDTITVEALKLRKTKKQVVELH